MRIGLYVAASLLLPCSMSLYILLSWFISLFPKRVHHPLGVTHSVIKPNRADYWLCETDKDGSGHRLAAMEQKRGANWKGKGHELMVQQRMGRLSQSQPMAV